MKAGARAPATRSSLVRIRRRLDQVRKGAALLRRKREALVQELFARAKPAASSRDAIDDRSRRAWRSLWQAAAAQGGDGLTPLGWPTREISVDLQVFELWGLRVTELGSPPPIVRSLAARGVLPAADEAASQECAADFETLSALLVEAAPREHVMRRLGQALSRTTRLVNTLEQRVSVRLGDSLATIQRTLDEREREEHLRTKRLVGKRR